MTNTTTRSPRRRRLLVLLGLPLALIATAAAAAFLFGRAGVDGGGSSSNFDLAWVEEYGTDTKVLEDSTTVSGAEDPTVDEDAGTLSLPSGLDFFPGDVYAFSGRVMSDGAPGEVVGLDFGGLPAGYEAEIVRGCGEAVVEIDGDTNDRVRVDVEIRRVTDEATNGWTLDEDAAVLAVRDGQEAPEDTLGCGEPFEGGAAS